MTKTSATVGGKEYANHYTYTKDKLTQVKHNTSADASGDVAYNFEYDALGRPTVVKVGNQVLSTTTYNADGTVQRVDYGNEDSVEYSYDEFKRTKGVRYNWDYEDRYVYEYGANGQVAQLTNTDILTVTTSEHDAAGRPARITRRHLDTGAHLYTGEVAYDEFNNLKTFKEQVGSDRAAYTTTFTHDNENRPTLLNFGSSRQVAYVYDGLGRISRRTVNAGSTGVATTYGYLAGGHGTGSTTPLVQTITQSGTTLTYAYDDAGNITSVSDGSKTISYEYDLLGQLTRVNDPYDTTSGSTGTTWKYAYDQGGNIQSKTAYAFTTGTVGSAVKTDSFTYGDTNWKDKLTAFNGQTITYDEIGNPTNDGTWNYTWIGGRQMRAIHKGEFGEQGYDEITFEYNENGLRTKKTRMYFDDATGDIGYKATNYTLHGKNIVHLSDGSNNLHFFYDAQNKPAVVIFNGTAYAYLYNLQGDVIGLLDSTGTKVVSYTYDAWGKPISMSGTLASTLGTIQPFRYRGYVYDEETGLYYLRTRYYSSDKARFVSSDEFTRVTSPRLAGSVYAYCRNAPTMMIDSDGFDSKCYFKAAYYIGSYLVSKEEYEAYASFLDAYRTTIGNSNAMLPALYENEGCFDIKSVSYTVEETYKSTLWENICTVSGFVGDTAEALSPLVAMGIHYAAVYFFNAYVDPDKVEGVLSDAIDLITNVIGQIEFYRPNAGNGHNHITHTLRIERNAFMKTIESFKLEICQEDDCPTSLIHSVSTGWNAR